MNKFDSIALPLAVVVGLAVGWWWPQPHAPGHEPAVSPPCPVEESERELRQLSLDVEMLTIERDGGGW